MTVATSVDLWSDHTGMTEGFKVTERGAAAAGRKMLRTTKVAATVCVQVSVGQEEVRLTILKLQPCSQGRFFFTPFVRLEMKKKCLSLCLQPPEEKRQLPLHLLL